MFHRVDALYICYWSLMDPLCQTQSLAYLRVLTTRGMRFAIMTFEQPQFRLSTSQAAATHRELAALGIFWYPLTYHKRYPLLATGFDCICGILTGIFIAWLHRVRVVHSRGSIPAAIALVLHAACRLKFLYDADSRLSEEYADNGHWARGSIPFRVTAFVEARARRAAGAIVVLSERLRQDFIREFAVYAPIEVIPCCVDTQRFRYDAVARERKRGELGLRGEKLFVYVGKVGPRYLVSELFGFFKSAREAFGDAHLLILSGDVPARFEELAQEHGIESHSYSVMRAPHNEVPQWLSAADVGFALIRPAGCERGSSPIKIAEYLATGLPVIVTDGIGDFSDLVGREDVGIVLRGVMESANCDALRRLQALWNAGCELRLKCRAVAVYRYDLERVGGVRFQQVYDKIMPAR